MHWVPGAVGMHETPRQEERGDLVLLAKVSARLGAT